MRHQLQAFAVLTLFGLGGVRVSGQTLAPAMLEIGTSVSSVADQPKRLKLPLTTEELLAFNDDFRRPHEAAPDGVPNGYDWYSKPKRGSWNSAPPNYTALTGWGQAFWAKGTTSADAHLLLRSQMTLLCKGDGRWVMAQSSAPILSLIHI